MLAKPTLLLPQRREARAGRQGLAQAAALQQVGGGRWGLRWNTSAASFVVCHSYKVSKAASLPFHGRLGQILHAFVAHNVCIAGRSGGLSSAQCAAISRSLLLMSPLGKGRGAFLVWLVEAGSRTKQVCALVGATLLWLVEQGTHAMMAVPA